jgi:hypothetical protein
MLPARGIACGTSLIPALPFIPHLLARAVHLAVVVAAGDALPALTPNTPGARQASDLRGEAAAAAAALWSRGQLDVLAKLGAALVPLLDELGDIVVGMAGVREVQQALVETGALLKLLQLSSLLSNSQAAMRRLKPVLALLSQRAVVELDAAPHELAPFVQMRTQVGKAASDGGSTSSVRLAFKPGPCISDWLISQRQRLACLCCGLPLLLRMHHGRFRHSLQQHSYTVVTCSPMQPVSWCPDFTHFTDCFDDGHEGHYRACCFCAFVVKFAFTCCGAHTLDSRSSV